MGSVTRIGDLTVAPAAAAQWWAAARGSGFTVAGLVGTGFDAYARLLHPVDADDDDFDPAHPVMRWRDVAAATGRTLTPTTNWEDLAAGWHPDLGQSPPVPSAEGLPRWVLHRVVTVLDQRTTTPADCVFLVWDGYAVLDGLRDAVPEADRLHMIGPQRAYLVLTGPVAAADTDLGDPQWSHPQRANVWWPRDHAWCVGTDTDLTATYIGGTRAAITALLTDPDLEALPVAANDALS